MDVTQYRNLQVKRPAFDGSQPCASVGADAMYLEGPNYNWQERDYDYIARTVCTGCHFLAECAEYAIKHERYGVWGGLTPSQRDKIRKELNIGVRDPYLVATYGAA